MYYVNSLLYSLGGLVPLVAMACRLRADRNVYFLGWLSWVAGMSARFGVGLVAESAFPALMLPGTPLSVMYSTLIETTFVASAYLFLRYHPSLKGVSSLSDLLAFGTGFGAGEAFTLAAISAIPVDFPVTLSSLWIAIERFSALMVHVSSATFLGYYLINGRGTNAVLGLASKDLGATISVAIVPILTSTGIEAMEASSYFELLFLAYGFLLIYLVLRLARSQGVEFAATLRVEDINYWSVSIDMILFALLSFLADRLAALVGTGSVLPLTASLMVVFTILVYAVRRPRPSMTEFSAGVFMGLCLARVVDLYFVSPSVLVQVPIQELLMSPMVAFCGVMIGLAVHRLIRI
ncbi:MAG: hypothetical protein ACE5OY_00800 [Candidatus Bathyarchaeia archaeon]